MREKKGFTLIELLIVVSLILIIASMAIPNLLRARIAANEASATGSIRTINTAQIMYQSVYPTLGYADLLSKLGPGGNICKAPDPAAACLIDKALADASLPTKAKSGYYFDIVVADASATGAVLQYTVSGSAAAFNQTGVRDFCSNEDGLVRFRVPDGQSSPGNAHTACAGWTALQ
jgi:prepilin-type N-terminal cleavage/methylation domain-containing protein